MIMKEILTTVEEIANDQRLPASMTDWANDIYDKLTNRDAYIQVKDLMVLSSLILDKGYGLHLLDRMLQETT